MTYRVYHLITLILLRLAGVSILLLGFELRELGVGPAIWWSAVGWGIAVLVVSLVFIGLLSCARVRCHVQIVGGK